MAFVVQRCNFIDIFYYNTIGNCFAIILKTLSFLMYCSRFQTSYYHLGKGGNGGNVFGQNTIPSSNFTQPVFHQPITPEATVASLSPAASTSLQPPVAKMRTQYPQSHTDGRNRLQLPQSIEKEHPTFRSDFNVRFRFFFVSFASFNIQCIYYTYIPLHILFPSEYFRFFAGNNCHQWNHAHRAINKYIAIVRFVHCAKLRVDRVIQKSQKKKMIKATILSSTQSRNRIYVIN